jgi:hypothetical protein
MGIKDDHLKIYRILKIGPMKTNNYLPLTNAILYYLFSHCHCHFDISFMQGFLVVI